MPYAIAAGPDGNLWFTEELGYKIGRITPGGDITEFAIDLPVGSSFGIVAGPDENLWFTGTGIGRITPAGNITQFSVPASSGGTFGIAAGADGNLWFTGLVGDYIGRITP
jgi:streptogramin lyase